ncbi:cell wall-binding protein [Clostridium beijerinckii]|uniref:cell wall-binding protein n=1 Tax=Clostridium beijerinckii TaxID=1520 RepID=UPI0008099F91|nr:cell wall-binding protein [Clostridium beijerinckii]OCA99062.1 cell wall-binding protein [Clostridium beijerinckii]
MTKKIIYSLLIVAAVVSVIPKEVSAEWKHNNTGWWYEEGKSYSTGWKQINGSWYYFGNDGYMKTGWILDKVWWYYLQDNGAMASGKTSIKGKEYELDNNGKWINNALPNRNVNMNISRPPSEEKMSTTSDFSLFEENGNTYFKIQDSYYLKGVWNIDGNIYIFDENGVLQKDEYTSESGRKYSLGDDGKVIECLSDKNYNLCPEYALTTKSTTENYEVKLDDSNMLTITDVNSEEPEKDGVRIEEGAGYKLDNTKPKAIINGNTLYCRTNQAIDLGMIKVSSVDDKSSSFPNLIAMSKSEDDSVAVSGINLSLEDGFFKEIHPTVIAYKAGKTTITINVNGIKTSFDIVVTE